MAHVSRIIAYAAFLAIIGLSVAHAGGNQIEHNSDLSQIAHPLSRVILHDKLHTTIRAATQQLHHSPSFSKVKGKFNGRYEQGTAGSGKYSGSFSGTTSPKSTRVSFAYTLDGVFKYMDVDLMFGASVTGVTKVNTDAKRISVVAEYESNSLQGTIHGKKVTDAKDRGIVKFYASPKGLQGKNVGRFSASIGRKRLVANYKLVLYGDSVRLAMRGTYAGEKFFVNYAASLNIIKLGLQLNPAMITRDYGTVTGTVSGKPFTKKYDISGMQMLNFTK